MKASLRKTGILLAALGMLLAGNLQAALIEFQVFGTVDEVWADPNGFGLSVGDTITATGVFNDSALTYSGAETVSFGLGSGNSMTLTVGSMTFVESEDNQFNSGFPQLLFNDGMFAGINFDTSFAYDPFWDEFMGFFNAGGELMEFSGDDGDFGMIFGTWEAGSYTATVIPVPAAVWLLGSGLLGLVGIARRKARV